MMIIIKSLSALENSTASAYIIFPFFFLSSYSSFPAKFVPAITHSKWARST